MPKIAYIEQNFTRKSQDLIDTANGIIDEYRAMGFSLTLRQLYYQFVARALLPNTDRAYNQLGTVVSNGRRAGLIDWNAIEDRTRFVRELGHWETPAEIIKSAADSFHLDRWGDQVYRPEVWIEKDALLGVIEDVCNKWDVPYFSCRGYVSDSEIWRAARRIIRHSNEGHRTLILYFGDHDPSGLDMTRDIEDRLGLFSRYEHFEVRRLALNMDQIDEYAPPPNPAKITDSRYEKYVAEHGAYSWELDALNPPVFTELIEAAIFEFLDHPRWDETKEREDTYIQKLTTVSEQWEELTEGM